jgi:hypothetical protein
MGRHRRRWFSRLVEDEDKEEMARNRKVETEDFLTVDPYKMETLPKEEDMEVLT